MAANSEEILVLVFDGAGGRYFKRTRNGRLQFLNAIRSDLHRRTSDAVSDRPGRTFASTGMGVRHAYELKHDKHKMEKHNFVHAIVKALDDSYDRGEFKHLALVAPERTLGEFRALAPDKLLKALRCEVPKELTQLSIHELEQRLKPFFEPANPA